jgi:hypothetical protein
VISRLQSSSHSPGMPGSRTVLSPAQAHRALAPVGRIARADRVTTVANQRATCPISLAKNARRYDSRDDHDDPSCVSLAGFQTPIPGSA